MRTVMALSATTMVPGCAAKPQAQTPKPIRPLGIQLYMLEDPMGKTLPSSLKEAAAIGYREVELPSFYNRPPAELRAMLDAAGLVCPSIHLPLHPMMPGTPSLDDAAGVADAFKIIGASYAVVPLFPLSKKALQAARKPDLTDFGKLLRQSGHDMTAKDWTALAHQLNEKGAALAKAGIQVGYHNHNVEFAKLSDGRMPFEVLLAETDPALVKFELDIGWVAAAGLDPVALLEAHADRIAQVHLKDLAATPPNTSFHMNSVDVGTGVIDWPRVIRAMNTAKIAHAYVEQEPPFKGPRIEAARTAYTFLSKAYAAAA